MSQPLHQQQGGMSLEDFAKQSDKSLKYIRKCALSGRIVGARKDSRTKKWWVYPPAKLVSGWQL